MCLLSVPETPDAWVWMNSDNTGQVVWKVFFFLWNWIILDCRFTACSLKWIVCQDSSVLRLILSLLLSSSFYCLSPFWHKKLWPVIYDLIIFPYPWFLLATDSTTEPRTAHGLWSYFLEPWRKSHRNLFIRYFCRSLQRHTDRCLQQ